MKITGDEPIQSGLINTGITIREQFAAMAMQGLIANSMNKASDVELARVAVAIADALINELNKSEQ